MCEDIMSLSNELIYSGQLKCGTESVANRTLKLTNDSGLELFHRQQQGCDTSGPTCWLSHLTSPQNKVVFANIDPIGPDALETLTSGKNITNATEAALTAQTVCSLLALGVPGREIGVITLYRSQLALLRTLFRAAGISPEVEIDSADRFQGRDKECIILSMVRSNEAGTVGDLLKDWRRVNVALTRARSKLVVLGSRRTLSNNDLLAKFMTLVDSKGWGLDLPRGADELHAFAMASTQQAAVVASAKKPSPGKMASMLPPQQQQQSPTSTMKRKRSSIGAAKVLQESSSAGNRHADGKMKKPGKVITGGVGASGQPAMRAKQAKLRQQVVTEIFEDLTDMTGEDFDFDG
jgi:DNA replication ATP-dependent helicase Dna2